MRRELGIRYAERLMQTGDDAPGVDEKLSMLNELDGNPQLRDMVNRMLLTRVENLNGERDRLHQGLREARVNQEHLREVLDRLSATPWYPAVYLGPANTPQGPRACVLHNNSRLVVDIGSDVDRSQLEVGQEVYLGTERNVIIAQAEDGGMRLGETGVFERWASDSRAIVKCRDEEFILQTADSLKGSDLRPGDLILWRKDCFLAYEKLERDNGHRFLLDVVPDVAPSVVGGQDAALQRVLSELTATLVAPETAEIYRVNGRRGILLYGPPGCGKTLMARVATSEVSRLSKTPCRFAVVKPAEWENCWVGESQRNVRECFAALNEAARDGFGILFLDEIESVGRIRGAMASHHDDKLLAALLAEIDGYQNRKNVAIMGATNRIDLVDPALLQRFDRHIGVSRPNRHGAEAILNIHLPASLPFNPNGSNAEATHEEAVETAVSTLYSPNADNDLCVIRFRDGKSRTVKAHELLSGRLLKQVAGMACTTAFEREVHGGERGVTVDDLAAASAEMIARLRNTLSVRNASAYLSDLPQDVDVVAVEPVSRPRSRDSRFVNAV